jgi:hypothetical protein
VGAILAPMDSDIGAGLTVMAVIIIVALACWY